ncbi:MAG: NAD(P)-dependent oxidoreductase [Deferribacteraceae bacterium]|jgi:nucleoside-diphosphate-sugar epimerase|nr:NAD(P)-dependent oxidoreductase [Deferribacteraceae bacterium]
MSDLVLITGAAGWLGRGLVNGVVNGIPGAIPRSKKKPSVRCLLLPNENADDLVKISSDVKICRGDITDRETLKEFFQDAKNAVVYHCAGIIHPKKVSQFKKINTNGAVNIWEEAESAKVKRIVIMSSNSPIGCNPHPDHLFDENSPYNPYMGYGKSKMLMELSIKERITKGSGLETVIIRAPWFYGPFQPPRQTEFFCMIRDGKAPTLGKGISRRSMSYIDNLAQGMILAAKAENAVGGIYWIADRRPYEMREIVDTIEEVMEKDFNIPCRHKRMKLPSVAADVARLMDFCMQKAGVYHQKIHVLSEMNQSIACSVEKAVRELGYNPQIDLREGMRRSIEWLMQQPEERKKLIK